MASNDKAIPLASLSIQELSTIKQRTEEDIANFTDSINALSEVIERFTLSRDSLAILNPENKGKDVLIPITSSVNKKYFKLIILFIFYFILFFYLFIFIFILNFFFSFMFLVSWRTVRL